MRRLPAWAESVSRRAPWAAALGGWLLYVAVAALALPALLQPVPAAVALVVFAVVQTALLGTTPPPTKAEDDPLRTRFLANVSHELRTPLTSISLYANMLDDEIAGPVTAEQRDILGRIKTNADDLLSLVTLLLDVGRIEAGKAALTVNRVSIEECLEAAHTQVAPQIAARGLTFDVALAGDVIYVNGSFQRLRQLFVNLLTNAVKFTESGGIRAAVKLIEDRVEVRISDTGIGIDDAHRERIFDEFTQADDSIRRRYGGSGLGLAICKKIATLHDGTIRAERNEPKGSVFVVTLPASP